LGEKGKGAVQTIVEAGKDNIDFLAFSLIAVLVVGGMTQGVDFWSAAGIAVVLMVAWVISRYALLSIQSRERLRALRETATVEAHKMLAEHATESEMEDLFSHIGSTGGEDEH